MSVARIIDRGNLGVRLPRARPPGVAARNIAASSLSDLGIVGCKSTAAVYFSPFSYPISRYWDAKSSKTILAAADFRFRRPKSDRLLALNLLDPGLKPQVQRCPKSQERESVELARLANSTQLGSTGRPFQGELLETLAEGCNNTTSAPAPPSAGLACT